MVAEPDQGVRRGRGRPPHLHFRVEFEEGVEGFEKLFANFFFARTLDQMQSNGGLAAVLEENGTTFADGFQVVARQQT